MGGEMIDTAKKDCADPRIAGDNGLAKSDPPPCAEHREIEEFEHLYKAYRARVYSLCLYMTGNSDDAEDLTQETFLRLFCNLDTFRGESAFYTWLRRVAVNVVLLRFQKAYWRRETSLDELMDSDPSSSCSSKKEFGADDRVLLEIIDRVNLERVIDQLPPGFKNVLLLHDLEGYRHTEISKQIGCSLGTSKSQLHKARLRVRELLQDANRNQAREQRLAAGSSGVHYTAVSQA
jgi:RNA polymerase sigma-70 factor, ECF subfamily